MYGVHVGLRRPVDVRIRCSVHTVVQGVYYDIHVRRTCIGVAGRPRDFFQG